LGIEYDDDDDDETVELTLDIEHLKLYLAS
jgi:hypothetical protein